MFGSPKRSVLLSGLLHGAAIIAILAATGVRNPILQKIHEVLLLPSDLREYRAVAPHKMTGGGGGGARDPLPASIGAVPRFATHQFAPPMVKIENVTPILPMEPTLVGDADIKVPMLDYARWGSPSGVNGPASGGPGKCCGIGTGEGDGIGDGKGPGLGPGEGIDGVTYNGSTRGVLTAPVLLWKTDPEYSEDARKAKLQGTVVLRIEVNTSGQAQNISIRQHLGLGLDERAMEAVRRWKFKPGTLNGKPAVVMAYIEVNFRLL